MDKKLFIQGILKYIFGVVLVGALLFIPAGTFEYWNGLLFMGMLFIPMFIAGIIMMIKNPELLRRRLNSKETELEQKHVILFSGIMFVSRICASRTKLQIWMVRATKICCNNSSSALYYSIYFIRRSNERKYIFITYY